MKKIYAAALFVCFLWGTMAPVSKLLLSGLSNMEVLGYGSAAASFTLFLLLLLTGEWKQFRSYSCADLIRLTIIGTIGYFCYSVCYYHGLSLLPAQTACTLHYLWPVFTVLLSALFLREPLSRTQLFTLLLSFAGTAVMLLPSFSGSASSFSADTSLNGCLSCILAALLYAAFHILNKQQGKSPLINMFLYITISALLALICCIPRGFTRPAAGQLLGLLWLGIFIDAAGFLLWAVVLQRSPASSIAHLAYLTPVISMFLSALFLQEGIHWRAMAGLCLILGGILFPFIISVRHT